MKFMILMSEDPSWEELSSSDQERIIQEHGAFESDLKSSGAFVDSGRFGPDAGAAITQSPDGTKTQDSNPASGEGAIGGYYLIDVATLEDALHWAQRCRFIAGTNWVYPVWE